MSESAKTLAYLAVAAVVLAVSFFAKPKPAVYDVSSRIGQMLTDRFEPEEAKRFTIVTFDEETATLREFEVAEKDGAWTIPSKGGYPADAFRQMAEATTGVSDREVLSIASESAADHERFGVVDPRSPKLEVGQTGVGVRVTLADENNGPLADLIIGKEVKDQPDQHYVRRQSQDVVYVVEIDPEQFSTDFEEWIEDDLLQVNPSDIQRVQIKDYSADLVIDRGMPQMRWERRGEYTLRYDDDDFKWAADTLKSFDAESKEYVDAPLTEDEALDEDVLRDLKSALDDLRIVDVESKPSRLSVNLKASEDFLDDNDAVASLVRRGFAPVQTSPDEFDILSSEGEVVCTLKDGVEYVLRFGNVDLGDEANGSQPPADSADGDADTESEGEDEQGVSRYLFVVARLNQDALVKPELEPVPDEAPAEPAEAEDDANEKTSSDVEADTDQESERDAALRRNKEKQEAYEKRVAQAEERVAELNERFGDWYYVVANSVYSKIRLSRDKFVKAAEADEEGDADENEQAEERNTSLLGAPDSAIPGLPEIDIDTDEPADEESPGAGDGNAAENNNTGGEEAAAAEEPRGGS